MRIDGAGWTVLQRCGAKGRGHGRGTGPAEGEGEGTVAGWGSGGARLGLQWCGHGAGERGQPRTMARARAVPASAADEGTRSVRARWGLQFGVSPCVDGAQLSSGAGTGCGHAKKKGNTTKRYLCNQ